MAIPKVMGIETEYGITVPDAHDFNPVLASSVLINSYVASELRRVRWDYEEETPLRDARGFETVMAAEAPSDEELGLANVILTNGARYYVDHAHPEYSTPECTNPRDLVIHDKAGERILERSILRASEAMPRRPARPGLQEQHRQQGRVLRDARELPRRPRGAVPADRRATSRRTS